MFGQPWLVNAVAREVVEKTLQRDYSRPVTFDHVHDTIQRLIQRRPVHLDSLLEHLKEPRVRNIIQPLLLGDEIPGGANNDDFLYTRDLGLVRTSPEQEIVPANPIYAELIIRALSAPFQERFSRYAQ